MANELDATNFPTKVEKYPSYFVSPNISYANYPLIISGSLSLLYPLGAQQRHHMPSSVSLLTDIEAGVGGSIISTGFFIPHDNHGGFSIKIAKMRTWLIASRKNKTYSGGILKYSIQEGGMAIFMGLGYFKSAKGYKDMPYISFGIGW
jgi:hypothetical protein